MWQIAPEMFDKILEVLPKGKTILELGSGEGTKLLSEHYNMISIEHDSAYIGLHKSTYIHAPLNKLPKPRKYFPEDTHWYDKQTLERELPKYTYDLILVDGPQNIYGRGGFYRCFELFNDNVPIFLDDTHRKREKDMAILISGKVQRPCTFYNTWTPKHFAVI